MRAAHCSQLLSDTYERNTGGGGGEHGRSWPVKSGGHKSPLEGKIEAVVRVKKRGVRVDRREGKKKRGRYLSCKFNFN